MKLMAAIDVVVGSDGNLFPLRKLLRISAYFLFAIHFLYFLLSTSKWKSFVIVKATKKTTGNYHHLGREGDRQSEREMNVWLAIRMMRADFRIGIIQR